MLAALLITGCAQDYEPIAFNTDGGRMIAHGVVGPHALEAFSDAVAQNPNVTTLVLEWVPGSADDAVNLQLGRVIHTMGLKTVVPAEGLVASGGTDLFLAGVVREVQDGGCVGVHTWSGPDGPGSETPRTAAVHAVYLRYYRDIDIDGSFYWFTLDAAGPDDIHWMTAEELSRFGVVPINGRTGGVANPAVCDLRDE